MLSNVDTPTPARIPKGYRSRLMWAWTVTLASFVLSTSIATAGDDWPQFRGPRGDGVVAELTHPDKWSEKENVAWTFKAEGAGWSSPVVARNRVFLSAAVAAKEDKPKDMSSGVWSPMSFGMPPKAPKDKRQFTVSAIDLENGTKIWETVVAHAVPGLAKHPSNTYATESPVADNQHVVVFFGACGKLACLSQTDGAVQWEKDFPVHKMSASFGTGSSLMMHDGRVYLQRCNEESSGLHVFQIDSGKKVWSVDPKSSTSWSTPYLWRNSNREVVVIGGSGSLTGYHPASGDKLWRMNGIPASFTSSPVADGDRLLFGTNSPFTASAMYALTSTADGDIEANPKTIENGKDRSESIGWFTSKAPIGMASPVVTHGLMYIPSGSGKLRVLDSKTGEEVFRARLPQGKEIVASPWAGNGKVFILDEDGRTYVIQTGREFKLLHVNRIEDTFWSTPAIAGKDLLLRGVDALYCIRGK